MADSVQALLRKLPSVADLLERPSVAELVTEYGGGIVKHEIRSYLDHIRTCVRNGAMTELPGDEGFTRTLSYRLVRFARPIGRKAINATGILLHTGLGRAPLCEDALAALAGCGEYSILQTSVETGGRSKREEKIEAMLRELTGCEAVTVVNNNAAATFIILNELACGKEVVISRGQLVEIGGAFRLPDVMARSGCVLREIGTTNRTHLRDYRAAACDATGALMIAHTSNYRIRGFSSMPGIEELAPLGKELGLPVIDDCGSGALVPLAPFGLADEPLVAHSISAGASVVCFSGDKLICGPQAGIICGTREIVDRIRKNPFARMFRVDKMTLAALEATLLHFVNETYATALPLYRMLTTPLDELTARAESVRSAVRAHSGVECAVVDDVSLIGSGSAPDEGIPTKALRVAGGAVRPSRLCSVLRKGIPSVFARAHEDAVVFDVRTVATEQIETLTTMINAALEASAQ
jgi:L-seryl-tRNA(Ser) seleniumtransferase